MERVDGVRAAGGEADALPAGVDHPVERDPFGRVHPSGSRPRAAAAAGIANLPEQVAGRSGMPWQETARMKST